MKLLKKNEELDGASIVSKLKKEKRDIYKEYYSYKKNFVILTQGEINFVLLEECLNKMAECVSGLTKINFEFVSNTNKKYISCKNFPESSMFEYCDSVRKFAISPFKDEVFKEKTFEVSKLAILLSLYEEDIVDDDIIVQMMYFITQKIDIHNALIGDKFEMDDTIYYKCMNLINPEKAKVKQL